MQRETSVKLKDVGMAVPKSKEQVACNNNTPYNVHPFIMGLCMLCMFLHWCIGVGAHWDIDTSEQVQGGTQLLLVRGPDHKGSRYIASIHQLKSCILRLHIDPLFLIHV